MALTSGDFSASQLQESLIKRDRMWKDDMLAADFQANVDVVTTLQKEQNARLELLESSEKDRDVRVHWINSCGETTEDISAGGADECDNSGNELGTDSKVYSITKRHRYKFSIDEHTFRTNNYSMTEVAAKGFAKADKALSEDIATHAVGKLEAFKGVNVAPAGKGTFNSGTTETDVPAANWDPKLLAYLYKVGILNQYSNPFLLSGDNLFEDRIVTMLAQQNGEGKGDANLYKMIRTYFDLFNVDTVNSPDAKTYLINRGAVAFANKHYYGAKPTKYMDDHRYSIASNNITGLRLDVHYKNRCEGDTIMHDFGVYAKWDYFLNPTGCDGGRTGVLAFKTT